MKTSIKIVEAAVWSILLFIVLDMIGLVVIFLAKAAGSTELVLIEDLFVLISIFLTGALFIYLMVRKKKILPPPTPYERRVMGQQAYINYLCKKNSKKGSWFGAIMTGFIVGWIVKKIID